MKRSLLLPILSAFILISCSNFNEKILIKEIFYKKHDGVYFIKASDKANFDFWNNTWSPRLLSNTGNFYRESTINNAKIFFSTIKKEGYVIEANFLGSTGKENVEVRINSRKCFLRNGEVTFIPAKNIKAGDNIISFVKKGIKISSLKLFPKRIINLPNYEALLNDERIIFLPAKIEFFMKADDNDKLVMETEGINFKYLKKKQKTVFLKKKARVRKKY